MMAKRGRKKLSIAMGLIMTALTLGKKRPDSAQLRQMEFSHSTQRMGLRFSERLRDLWRGRWLKLRR